MKTDPERVRRWDECRREAARRYEDKVRKEVKAGERPWSSLEPKPKSREKWEAQYGSEARVEFFGNQPCDICGREPTDEHPSHNHHVRTGGMGMKAHHRWIIPLCNDCHRAMHGKNPPWGPETAQAQAEYWAGRWAKHTEDG